MNDREQYRHKIFRILLAGMIVLLAAAGMQARKPVFPACPGPDSIPRGSLVFVEGYDTYDRLKSRAVGVIVRKGFVAVNYHIVAGMKTVRVFRPGDPEGHESVGYLTVEESKDLVIVEAGELNGPVAPLRVTAFPEDGEVITFPQQPESRSLKFIQGVVSGSKELLELQLPQVLSHDTRDCTSGPVFTGGKVAGFLTAGYLDDKYYAYVVPSRELRRIMNRSFIIKDFKSLADTAAIGTSYFQKSLVESLSSVIWLSFDDAERLARKKHKMILVNVYTNWAGWSKLMEKKTYSTKNIIRYINENFCAVRFDAESADTVVFNNLAYYRNNGSDYHTLAYSLLEGKMDFPSTVFLDEEINMLLVIPGYMDPDRMEVVLHYFSERAFRNEKLTFREYEREFLRRKQQY